MADVVVPGVWWLHGTRGSNVYLVEASDGQLALVDTGFGSNVDPVIDEVAAVGGGRPLARILLTHDHVDHMGAAAALRSRTGAAVAAGVEDCTGGPGAGYSIGPVMGRSHVVRFLSRWLLRRRVAPLTVDVPLAGEVEVLPGIVAIPAPGHTPGSYVFVAAHLDAAFAGDLVISHGGRLSRPLARANTDNVLYERTLAAIASRAAEAGCPGHGQPLADGFRAALQELVVRPRPRLTPASVRGRLTALGSFAHHMHRRRVAPRRPAETSGGRTIEPGSPRNEPPRDQG